MRPPGRAWLAGRPAGSRLKLEARGELQPSGRPGSHRLAEEGRAEVADETDVVDVVQDVEAVQGERGGGAFVFLGPDQIKVTRPAQVELSVPRSLQAVAVDSRRVIAGESVMVVVPSGCHAVRLAGVQEQAHADIEVLASPQCSQEIKTLALVEISHGPLTGKVVVVCGKRVDAAGPASADAAAPDVVVDAAESILDHAVEEPADVPPERYFQRMALKMPRGFNLAQHVESWIGARQVKGRRRRVHIPGTEHTDRSRAEIRHCQGRRLLQLSFDTDAVLHGVRNFYRRIQPGHAGRLRLKLCGGERFGPFRIADHVPAKQPAIVP